MTTKRAFIQSALVAWAPLMPATRDGRKVWDFDLAIRSAEVAWDLLTARGYGAVSSTGPRESRDWYAELDEWNQARFTRAFRKYARKGDGKQGGAESWWKLVNDGLMTPELADWIEHAAGEEAAMPRDPTATRKMFQGWLSDRRWESWPQPKPVDSKGRPVPTQADARTARIAELRGLVSTSRQLLSHAANPGLEEAIERYRAELASLGADPDATAARINTAEPEGIAVLAHHAPPEARAALSRLGDVLGRGRAMAAAAGGADDGS